MFVSTNIRLVMIEKIEIVNNLIFIYWKWTSHFVLVCIFPIFLFPYPFLLTLRAVSLHTVFLQFRPGGGAKKAFDGATQIGVWS